MTDYPIVRFVSAPGSTTARLDLNDGAPFTVDHEGFSFGAPSLEAEPLSNAAPYGWRTLTIKPSITGNAATAAPALSKLSVELLRRTNWLMYRFSADTAPVWIQTYKSAPPPLDFTDVTVGDVGSVWTMTFEVTADAFIRGQRVNLGPFEITNNPLRKKGITVELPDIVGDAVAPLNVDVKSDQDMYVQTWLVGASAVDEGCTYDFESPVTYTTDWFTVPSGAPIGGLESGSDAVGGQYRRSTTLTGAFQTVLRSPGGGDPIPVGNYRVFGRFKQTANVGDAGVIGVRLGGGYTILNDLTGNAWQPERRVNPHNYFGWHDLGPLYLPAGALPEDPAVTGSRAFAVQVRRVSGDAPEICFGGFMLLPIHDSAAVNDSRMLKANMGAALIPVGNTLQVDAHNKRLERNPRDLPLPNAAASGGFPQVKPGYRNFLHVCGDLHEMGALTTFDLNRLYTVNAHYYPQYLHPVIA